jgi:hypothetical protein
MIDYRKILIAYINGVMECEGVHFYPVPGLTPEEEIAWAQCVLAAGVNANGAVEMEAYIRARKS